jgi:uncharacterized protein (TIGR03437 family)
MLIRSSTPMIVVAIVWCLRALTAQPFPMNIQDLFNAYSFIRAGLPNYGIAQGSIFTIFGNNLSEFTASQGVPLQASFAGVTMNVTVAGVTIQAIPYLVSPGTITAILPSKTPVGDGTVTISSGGQTSSAPIHVIRSAFGLLTLLDATNVAVVQNSSQGGELLSQTNAANPGEYLVLWGSGLGPSAGDETQSQTPTNLTSIPMEVDIGGLSATVTYHGRSAYPGVDQINVIVPPGVSGCYVSVVVVAGGVPSNFATIPVASTGRICSDTGLTPVTPDEYQRLLSFDNVNVGTISLVTLTTSNPTMGTAASDSAYVLLQKYTGQQFTSAGFLLQASIGSCIVFYGAGSPPYFRWTSAAQLNAGPQINLNGPNGPLALVRLYPGYAEPIGTSPPIIPPTGGTFTFDNGSGGPDVGAFTASLSASLTNTLVWTNRSSITAVNRANGQLITWSGGIPGSYVSIFGYSFAHEYGPLAQGSDVYTYFTCSASVSKGQFTVPEAVLESLLPSGAVLSRGLPPAGNGYLYVVNGTSERFSAPGLDLGLIYFGVESGISVPFN